MSTTLSDDNNIWFDTIDNLNFLAVKKRVPFIGAFEITARCNLKCNMCYVRREATKEVFQLEKSASEWIEMGRQVSKAGTLFLLITGGEPLIRPDFKESYEGLNEIGFNIALYTNGTLIDETFINWISKIPPNKIGISLYGASPETYARVTGNPKGYYKTIEGLDLLLKSGINIQLRTAINRNNVDDLEAMDKFAFERDININHSFDLTKPLRASVVDIESTRLTPEEISDIYIKRMRNKHEKEKPFISMTKYGKPSTDAMFCSAGKSSYWVTWDGKMIPCALMNSPSTDPFNTDFISAWDELKNSINEIKSPIECKDCEFTRYCGVCPAKLQAETGSFEKISKYICETAKLAKNNSYNE